MLASKKTYLIEIVAVTAIFLFHELFVTGIKYSSQVTEVICLLLITYFFHKRGVSWKDVGFRKPDSWWKAILYFLVCVLAIGLTFNFIIAPLFPSGANGISHAEPLSLTQMLLELVIVGIGTAAIGEEMLFRGFLLNNINAILGKGFPATAAAVITQAVCFAVLHSGIQGMVSAGVLGLIIGIVYVLSGRNLWVVMAAHAVPDVLSFISSYQNQ